MLGIARLCSTVQRNVGYLEHIGEPVDPPPSAPARAPPQTELALGPAHADTDRHTANSGDAVDAMPDGDAHIAD